jgi:hypothetical protein
MAKSKVMKSGTGSFAKGGPTGKVGKQTDYAGTQTPGVTASIPAGPRGKFAKGGPSGMVGKQGGSMTAKAK